MYLQSTHAPKRKKKKIALKMILVSFYEYAPNISALAGTRSELKKSLKNRLKMGVVGENFALSTFN